MVDDLATTVMQRIETLATYSEEPNRLTRRFATPALQQAHNQVAAWMHAAGMTVRHDNIGNLIGRYAGTDDAAKTLLLGSHLDTVRDAGKYDGPLGVLTALACVEDLHQHNMRLPFAIEVIAFADEEGLRFGSSYLGSKTLAGTFAPAYLNLRDDDGISMGEAIRAAGGDPAELVQDRRLPDTVIAYCEVHIEQGPQLESHDLPVGVVTAIAGQSRLAVSFVGSAGHAGTVPMLLRHDALCAAAEFVLAVESLAREQHDLVATVGQLAVQPGASNVIPGRAVLSLDVRHSDDATRAHARDMLHTQALQIAAKRRVNLVWEVIQESPATPCNPALQALFTHAIESYDYPVRSLTSGAGHDAVALADLAPVAMLFVRCKGGVSHHPDESVETDDVAVAIKVLRRFLDLLAGEYKP